MFLLKSPCHAADFSHHCHSVLLQMWAKHQQITCCIMYRNTAKGWWFLTMLSVYHWKTTSCKDTDKVVNTGAMSEKNNNHSSYIECSTVIQWIQCSSEIHWCCVPLWFTEASVPPRFTDAVFHCDSLKSVFHCDSLIPWHSVI